MGLFLVFVSRGFVRVVGEFLSRVVVVIKVFRSGRERSLGVFFVGVIVIFFFEVGAFVVRWCWVFDGFVLWGSLRVFFSYMLRKCFFLGEVIFYEVIVRWGMI